MLGAAMPGNRCTLRQHRSPSPFLFAFGKPVRWAAWLVQFRTMREESTQSFGVLTVRIVVAEIGRRRRACFWQCREDASPSGGPRRVLRRRIVGSRWQNREIGVGRGASACRRRALGRKTPKKKTVSALLHGTRKRGLGSSAQIDRGKAFRDAAPAHFHEWRRKRPQPIRPAFQFRRESMGGR